MAHRIPNQILYNPENFGQGFPATVASPPAETPIGITKTENFLKDRYRNMHFMQGNLTLISNMSIIHSISIFSITTFEVDEIVDSFMMSSLTSLQMLDGYMS